MIGVRAPMHDAEKPVVRPYMLVENIEAIVAIAKQAGAVVAVPPMKLPGMELAPSSFKMKSKSGFGKSIDWPHKPRPIDRQAIP